MAPSKSKDRGLLEDRTPSAAAAIMFLLMAIGGIAYILFAKLSQWPQIWTTLGPLAVMVFYAILMLGSKHRLRNDHSGDNLYYLGFLYTLTSLGLSLYQFTAENAQAEIVANFGIALTTTIAGVALRVVFNQMRLDPADVERSARMELADASRKVRQELENTVMELNNFQRVALQSSQDGYQSVEKLTNETLSKAVEQLEGLAAKTVEVVELLTSEFSGSTKEINAALTKNVKGLNSLAKKLENVKTTENIVNVEIAPSIQKLENVLNGIHQSHEVHHSKMTEVLAANDATLRSAQQLLHRSEQLIQRSDLGGRDAPVFPSVRGGRRDSINDMQSDSGHRNNISPRPIAPRPVMPRPIASSGRQETGPAEAEPTTKGFFSRWRGD